MKPRYLNHLTCAHVYAVAHGCCVSNQTYIIYYCILFYFYLCKIHDLPKLKFTSLTSDLFSSLILQPTYIVYSKKHTSRHWLLDFLIKEVQEYDREIKFTIDVAYG